MKTWFLIAIASLSLSAQALTFRVSASKVSCTVEPAVDPDSVYPFQFQLSVQGDLIIAWDYTNQQGANAAKYWCLGVLAEASDSQMPTTGYVVIDTLKTSESTTAMYAEEKPQQCTEPTKPNP